MSEEVSKLTPEERLEGLMLALSGRIEEAHQEAKGWYRTVRNSIAETNQELSMLKARLDSAENKLRRHDSGFARASDADLKQNEDIKSIVAATGNCVQAIDALEKKLEAYEANASTKAESMQTVATEAVSQTQTLESQKQKLEKEGSKSTLGLVLTIGVLVLQIVEHYISRK